MSSSGILLFDKYTKAPGALVDGFVRRVAQATRTRLRILVDPHPADDSSQGASVAYPTDGGTDVK